MEGPNNHRKFAHGLEPFILFAFTDLPTVVKHNYEYLKTAETVGIKRKREIHS